MKRNPPGVGRDASGGIWYYLWLKPNWKLYIERAEHAQHTVAWSQRIVPEIVEHYGLDDDSAQRLFPLSQALPRGRVITMEYGAYFRIAHGGDFPSEYAADEQMSKIVRAFGLSRRRVEVEFQEHEAMQAQHKKLIQQIIGKVPY